jgi:hypothetical protein
MASQICPMCKKEFTPKAGSRSFTYCSSRCRHKYDKHLHELDLEYRKELGLSPRLSIAASIRPREK